jgi:hypothetical protein
VIAGWVVDLVGQEAGLAGVGRRYSDIVYWGREDMSGGCLVGEE